MSKFRYGPLVEEIEKRIHRLDDISFPLKRLLHARDNRSLSTDELEQMRQLINQLEFDNRKFMKSAIALNDFISHFIGEELERRKP